MLAYLGAPLCHPDQLGLAQFSSPRLRDVVNNLDMLAIARTTKIATVKRHNVEDENVEAAADAGKTWKWNSTAKAKTTENQRTRTLRP